MSLQVLVAHSGERITADPAQYPDLDAFKSWLASASGVSSGNQILLTSSGKQVKLPSLSSENEIFLYNRQLISHSGDNAHSTLPAVPFRSLSPPPNPPRDVSSQDDLQAWQRLFGARRTWAKALLSKSQEISSEIHKHFDANNVIERGVALASANLGSHVKSLEQKYDEAKTWSTQAEDEQDSMLASLGDVEEQVQSLPGHPGFIPFLPKLASSSEEEDVKVLKDFVDPALVKEATSVIKSSRRTVRDRVDRLGDRVNKVASEANALVARVEKAQTESIINTSDEASQLVEEIELVANKISTDYDTIMSLPNTSKSISQAYKTATVHTKSLLPSAAQYFKELEPHIQQVVEQRNTTATRAIETMKRIAVLESSFAQANSQVMALDLPPEAADAFDLINLLSQLPFVYGTLLIEAVRRNEWSEKIKGESAVLAEDIAGYREEEERRRKKWLKNIGHLIDSDLAGTSALKFELNLQAEQGDWPDVTRDDISDYLQALREFDGIKEIIEELEETAKDLDKPTKRQAKKGKNFKMGSMHEAANGKNSMLLRDNDEAKMLRETNTKLEDDLKGHKSRIRKLEDMVYRQGQTGRSASGNIFQTSDAQSPESITPEPVGGSPRSQNTLARQASANSRRTSMTATDDKSLARRIVSLEAELLEEKRKRQEVEKENESRKTVESKIQTEIEEARSTKNDLMENMEAQHRELADERRLLNEEITKHKMKVEELEDELDHVNLSLNNLEETMKHRDEAQEDHMKVLRLVLSNLGTSKNNESKSMEELVNSLDEAAEQSSRHTQELSQAISTSKSDKEIVETSLKKQEAEYAALRSQLEAVETEASSLRDTSAADTAKAAAYASELEDARNQLRTLRAKFAEGETGSEALRQRLENQAAKASALATELAEKKSHVNSLHVENLRLQKKQIELQNSHSMATARLAQRTIRDRELTNRLVNRNDELARLLETLGLSMISNPEGNLEIQRTSKLASGSLTFTDPSGSTITNTTGTAFMGQTIDVYPDPTSLQWMQASTVEEEETLFRSLLSKIDLFNISTFSGAIVKLRRDVEWTGKKWKNEARNYRDKFHRAQSEANSKIAFRSFKEGDLALFLPTRNQATRPWAAFNIGAPHYFLHEQDSHKLLNREWLVARISKLQERVVDLSKTMESSAKAADGRSLGESEGGMSFEDDNPFELSDGLRWYLLDASEEKFGAPSTPSVGKSTVASAAVDAKGSVRMKKSSSGNDATAKLNKSLESRRSSSNSTKRNSISEPANKQVTGDQASAHSVDAASLPRTSSNTQLRPQSSSSMTANTTQQATSSTQTSTPSGLGIRIANSSNRNSTEENPSLLRPPSAGESPSKPSLLTIFSTSPNSPPKAPSRWSFRNASTSPSRLGTNSSSHTDTLKAPPLAARSSSPPKVPDAGAASSLARQLNQAGKSSTATTSAPQTDSIDDDKATSPSKQSQASTTKEWDTVWSVEMNMGSHQRARERNNR